MTNRKALVLLVSVLTLVGAGSAALTSRSAGGDMTTAAQKFLASLSAEQRATATMDFDAPARLDWHFIPKNKRKGLQVKLMNDAQRKAAHALLRSALSKAGYEKTTTIMHLEAILRELQKGRSGPVRDPERYYFTVFGKPDATGKWGLSIEGHHISLNFVVTDGQLTAHTPAFFGANPGLVMGDYGVEGIKKGTRVLAKEETLGFDLLHSLSAAQRQAALIAAKAPADLRSAGDAQAPDSAPVGLPASKMGDTQVKTLQALIQTYADNMPAEIAEARLGEIDKAGIANVYFAWAGADKPGVGHYYRVQGPTFLIEFCNTQPDSAGNPANHIHSFWRDLRGDFGIPVKK